MKELEILQTAHIHLDSAMLRVHVEDSDAYCTETMSHSPTKPDYVLYVSKSNDPAQRKQSILINVTDGYDLVELSEWISFFKRTV